MGIEVIGLIAGLLALIPLIINARNQRRINTNAIGKVESSELDAGMDAVDKLQSTPEAGEPIRLHGPTKL